MNPQSKRYIKTLIKWTIAIAGLSYVLMNLSWNDYVLLPGPDGRPVQAKLTRRAALDAQSFFAIDPISGAETEYSRDQLLVRSDRDRIVLKNRDGSTRRMDLLALKVQSGSDYDKWPLVLVNPRTFWQRYWNLSDGQQAIIVQPTPDNLSEHYTVRVPYPVIDMGLKRRLVGAEIIFLVLAMAVYPIVMPLTGWRWWMLMKPLGITMSLGRTFALTMVGNFYNTFMPGSTGGDVFKAYYAARNTTHKTYAVMSVVVDRAIGLLALVIMGGTAAAYQALQPHAPGDEVQRRCMQVAIGSGLIVGGTFVGLFVYYIPLLRRLFLIDFVLSRLPMQKQINNAREVMEIYRRRPLLIFIALIMTLPVHGAVAMAVSLAGRGLGLPITWGYYWIVVPVVVLAGAIPISPQGAGVMEFFAIILTRSQGCTVTDAFTLTMSIRVIGILWNLTGGIFVLRGGYHPPSETETQSLGQDELDPNASPSS